MRLFRHVAWRALTAFLGALAAVVALFLAVDYAENASAFRGPGWVVAAAEIYLNRAAFVAWQTGPAAMLLAAALTASGLRRTREYTAMRALGLGPWRVAAPVLAVALLAAGALAWLGDAVATDAGARADSILAQRFGRGQPPRRWLERESWFRGEGGRIYHLREAAGGGYERVTVLELTAEFRLARRIDAARMAPGGERGAWLLEDGTERRFGAGGLAAETFARRVYPFGDGADAFQVRAGRPAQMRAAVLSRQIALRRALGLPSAEHVLEWHQKWSWPLAAMPASLLALSLALRRERRGHFTASLTESVAVSLAFWLLQGLCFSLGISGGLAPAAAAWLPDAAFLAAGLAAMRRLPR